MATKHWVRDVPLTDPQNYIANGNHIQANAVLYNFLRVAGWDRIWECDGERGTVEDPNHVQDGNVQATGLTYWTSFAGGVVSKDTSKVHSGIRSLKVVANAASKGVDTAPLVSMANPSGWVSGTGDSLTGPVGREMTYSDTSIRFSPSDVGDYLSIAGNADPNNDGEFVISKYVSGTSAKFENPSGSPTFYYDGAAPPPPNTATFSIRPRYEVVVWAAADVAFDLDVDQGDGSYVTVGTIPANGNVFTRYEFTFRRISTGNSVLRFVSQGAGTLYIGGVHVFSAVFDRPAAIKRGTDGVLTNPDKFSTAGSFTPDDADIGKILFVWDPTNNKNSGAYPILSVAAGVATLDLRSGSATLTSQGGLAWRLATIDYLSYPNDPIEDRIGYAGFGLESIHTSKWRLFLRQSQRTGPTGKGSILWSAPEDTDFDFSTGTFYKSGPSVHRNRQAPWTPVPDSAAAVDEHLWRGPYSYKTTPHDCRCFLMTDEDGAFVNFFLWDEDGDHGCHLHGYLGSTFPGVESHYLFARWEDRGVENECYFDANNARFGKSGSTYGHDEVAVACGIAQLGIGTAADNVATQSNSGPNPWSGDEWKRPLILWRDIETNRQEMAIQNSDCGIYQARANMVELTTFDSEGFLHLAGGYCWEWSGETVL